DSWPHARRVVYKAEQLEKGRNLRFVVTSRTGLVPLALYNWYVRRGEPERWIKDLKDACSADRLSCHRFWANPFRLLLYAAAYCPAHPPPRPLVGGGPPPPATRPAAPAPDQDRWRGPPPPADTPPPSGEQSPGRAPLAPHRRSLPTSVNNPGHGHHNAG